MRRFIGSIPNSTALAWELLRELRNSSQLHPLVIVPDNSWAYNLRDDLRLLAPQLPVHFLPPLECDLLRNRGPSIYRRVERIRFFCALADAAGSPQSPNLFLLSVAALNQRAPSMDFWKRTRFQVKVGDMLSRTDLSERLATLGYIPAELVETHTQYAVRGSIVDVFPPLYDKPLRLELFDDCVQSIRSFHPDSQRRIADLDSLWLVPCHEFIYPETRDEEFRQRLRQYLVDTDWDKADRDALMERFGQQSFFATIDYWAPLMNPHNGEDWRHELLGPSSALSVIEAHALDPELRRSQREMESSLQSARQDAEWVPAPDLFLTEMQGSIRQLGEALAQASVWLSSKALSGLPQEPDQRESSVCTPIDALASRLRANTQSENESPLEGLAQQLREWHSQGLRTCFASPSPSQLERLSFLLSNHGIRFRIFESLAEFETSSETLGGILGALQGGLLDPQRKLVLLPDELIFGERKKKPSSYSSGTRKDLRAFSDDLALLDLHVGDLIVQKEHGIGKFLGSRHMDFGGIPSELLEIEYKDGSKLLLPVTRLNTLQKFSGGSEAPLDKLGGSTWETKKARAKKELQSIAGELLHLHALRQMARGPELKPAPAALEAFAASFPFVETPDQARAIQDVLKELQGPRPMDRLVCGDVGYGKTEVALRAAHAAVAAGYQVAVLVPTTILAAQHEATFKRRLESQGFKVAALSRFKTPAESKKIMDDVREGRLHVLIGTHRLLGSEIAFKQLGLLVIDEEQRFGVTHKEKLKKLRHNVHILTLTATPIPRTLNMAMSGLKDISIISTPPADRLSVRTHVARLRDELITEAVTTELKRGGQVFFVHNRVQTQPKMFERLTRLLPGIRVEWVHGQMDKDELEKRMFDFYEGRTQVLLTTNIIESGLDVPNANTMIVDRADTFGLAQLYQMRGRIGRSNVRAYAYFLLPEQGEITQDAEDRLAVLEAYQELGSGFHVASHDLEIRGAGDLLGRAQSGSMSAVGFETSMQLLEESLAELKGEAVAQQLDPDIELGIDTHIPEAFIPELGLRLMVYRRLAGAGDEQDVETIRHELDDRFGSLPEGVENLIFVMRIKCQLRRLGVRSLKAGRMGFALSFDSNTPVNTLKLVESIKRYPAHFQMNPDGKLLLKRPGETLTPDKLLQRVEGALSQLEAWCG